MDHAAVMTLLRDKAVELLELTPEQIREDVSFQQDLHVDSLALVEYTMALEDDLGITLPEEDVADLTTIGQFADLIIAKTAPESTAQGAGGNFEGPAGTAADLAAEAGA